MPERFNAYIGGFLGISYQVELKDGVLAYSERHPGHNNPKRSTIKPTPAQWREFRQVLDDLKVWQWRKDYPSHGTADGTQWSLDIAFADRATQIRGDNNYPDATGKPNGEPEPTPSFDRYLKAVRKLTGGKTFN